jgi:hypothetical protein
MRCCGVTDRAIMLHVDVGKSVGRVTGHPIDHAPFHQARHIPRLLEVEHAPVVGDALSGAHVFDDNRVMAEALPDGVAGTERHEVDAELGSRRLGAQR